MPTPQDPIRIYRQLAEEHHRQNHPQDRDRFLLLAADAALAAGQQDEAERLRKSLLAQNPNHLLRPYASMADALQSRDILAYVKQLRRSYPLEIAESTLKGMQKPGAAPAAALAGGNDRPAPAQAAPKEVVKLPPTPFKLLADKPASSPPASEKPKATRPAPTPRQPVWPPPLPDMKTSRGNSAARRSSRQSDELEGNSWVGSALFLIALAATVAAIAWGLARPFWFNTP